VAKKRKKATENKTSSTHTKKARLRAADVERFKEILLEKRKEIIGNVNEIEDETLKKSRLDATGGPSRAPGVAAPPATRQR